LFDQNRYREAKMRQFDFKNFWQSLSTAERKQLADDAGTTVNYIKVHLVYGRRTPTKRLMDGLFQACRKHDAHLTREQVIGFFYEPV
jgi:hypothetical protein